MFGLKHEHICLKLFLSGLTVIIFLLVQFVLRGQESRFSLLFANDKIVEVISTAESAGNNNRIDVNTFYYSNTGLGSYYGKRFHKRKTASGERYDMHGFTAAHKFLPFGTIVRVTNEDTGLTTLVRINDRGPFKKSRIIDLSRKSAEAVGGLGLPNVSIESLVLPSDFTYGYDDKFYFGYSLDKPLIIAKENEIEILDSENDFNKAYTKYINLMSSVEDSEIYLFVDFAMPYFSSSEGRDFRYVIASLGKEIPLNRRQLEYSQLF